MSGQVASWQSWFGAVSLVMSWQSRLVKSRLGAGGSGRGWSRLGRAVLAGSGLVRRVQARPGSLGRSWRVVACPGEAVGAGQGASRQGPAR